MCTNKMTAKFSLLSTVFEKSYRVENSEFSFVATIIKYSLLKLC